MEAYYPNNTDIGRDKNGTFGLTDFCIHTNPAIRRGLKRNMTMVGIDLFIF